MAFQFSWIKHVGCQCSQSTMIDWKKYIIKGFQVLKNSPFGFTHVSQIIFCVRCAMVGLWAEVSAPMALMRRLTVALNRCTVHVRITSGRHNWYILAVYHWNRGGSVHPRWWVGFTFKKSGLLCTDDNGIKHRYNHTDTSCRDCTKGGYPGFRFISI